MISQTIAYEVKQTHLLSRHITQLVLQPRDKAFIEYLAGQYIKLIHEDGYESPFSIAAKPTAKHQIELHVGHPAKNQRAQEILRIAKEKQFLNLQGPFGKCTIERLLPGVPVIFYVRGTGFAPVKAIMEELLISHSSHPLHLFWGSADKVDFYMLDLIKNWEQQFDHFHYTEIASRSVDQHKLRDAVLAIYPDLSAYQVYASGPPEMVYAARDDLAQHGLQIERFYSDVLDYAATA